MSGPRVHRRRKTRRRPGISSWLLLIAIALVAGYAGFHMGTMADVPGLVSASERLTLPDLLPFEPEEEIANEPPPASNDLQPSATPWRTTNGAPSATGHAPPTPLAVARTTPYSRVAFTPDAALAARVSERTSRVTGKIGVAIKDLTTGRGVLIDPDGEFEAASLFKLSVMYEVYRQRDLGTLSLGEVLTLTARHVAYDLGTLDRPAGSAIRLGEALERMITVSDNSSAILLTDRVNAYTVNQTLRALGMPHTRLVADDLRTSPADMLLFFEMLALGQGPSPEASAEMVHLLARQRVNDRIPLLLPDEVIVAHKTGNLPGVVNDAGIVYGPRTTFVIAVLVDRTRDEGAATRMTAELAALAYEYFNGQASEGEVPRFPAAIPTATPGPTVRPVAPTAPAVTATVTSTEPLAPPTATSSPTNGAPATPTEPLVTATATPVATNGVTARATMESLSSTPTASPPPADPSPTQRP